MLSVQLPHQNITDEMFCLHGGELDGKGKPRYLLNAIGKKPFHLAWERGDQSIFPLEILFRRYIEGEYTACTTSWAVFYRFRQKVLMPPVHTVKGT